LFERSDTKSTLLRIKLRKGKGTSFDPRSLWRSGFDAALALLEDNSGWYNRIMFFPRLKKQHQQLIQPVQQTPFQAGDTGTNPPVPPQEPPKELGKRVLFLFVAIVIIYLIAFGIFMLLGGGKKLDKAFPKKEVSKPQVENGVDKIDPTKVPYYELTIPALREKTYESKLGNLEAAYDNLNYTAYLTSYTSEGLKINGLLTKPTGEMPEGGWPAIVFIHGYIPPTQYETMGQAYSTYVDYLARNGFVVFKIDLRGHGESEGEPGGGYYGADYVTDALNAYTALESSDFVNRKKVGMWGHSMAGNIVLRSLAAKPDIPASVIWAGAVYSYLDQRKYGINDNSYRPPDLVSQRNNRRQRIYEKVGSPSAESVFWQQMAPTSYLNDIKGAIEIHHAIDDDVVNIGYSRDLVSLLDKTSVPHEFYEYESGGHNISGASFDQAMGRTVEFFRKYLK
jgi:uncharacterized protein